MLVSGRVVSCSSSFFTYRKALEDLVFLRAGNPMGSQVRFNAYDS